MTEDWIAGLVLLVIAVVYIAARLAAWMREDVDDVIGGWDEP